MINKKVNKTIILSIMFIIIGVFFFYSITIKEKRYELDEIKTIYNNNPDTFAIYIQNQNGTYELLDDSIISFPSNLDYRLNMVKSGCIDENGSQLPSALTYENNGVHVETSKTMYCYLYFDLKSSAVTIPDSENYDIGFYVKNLQAVYSFPKVISNDYGEATWDNKRQSLVISSVSNYQSTFELDNLSIDQYSFLRNYVESVGNSGDGKIVDETSNNVGFRYQGLNPNNYIWFNNEIWRIIGSVPVCLQSNCDTPTTRLVKIIRNNPVGVAAYESDTNYRHPRWGDNSLYKLLNVCYYGKRGYNDILCSSYCPLCDFSDIGISSNKQNYYTRMIKRVVWNPNEDVYTLGTIGLMDMNDYDYASYSEHRINHHSAYSNWLYMYEEWMSSYSTKASSYTNGRVYYVSEEGEPFIDHSSASSLNSYGDFPDEKKNIRPVVYLDQDVVVLSGNGSEANPYLIALNAY